MSRRYASSQKPECRLRHAVRHSPRPLRFITRFSTTWTLLPRMGALRCRRSASQDSPTIAHVQAIHGVSRHSPRSSSRQRRPSLSLERRCLLHRARVALEQEDIPKFWKQFRRLVLRTGAPWARDVDLRREVEFEAQRITEMVTCIEDTGPWLRGQVDTGTSTLDYVRKDVTDFRTRTEVVRGKGNRMVQDKCVGCKYAGNCRCPALSSFVVDLRFPRLVCVGLYQSQADRNESFRMQFDHTGTGSYEGAS